MTRPARTVKPAVPYIPAGAQVVDVERMSPAFTKYHLDDGRALHRFRREDPQADPHDHPWSFETEILEGGYVEEVFTVESGTWRSALVHRPPFTSHRIAADHIHRIVELPTGECWTLVQAGQHEREIRFWRFGDTILSRAWHERRWSEYHILEGQTT